MVGGGPMASVHLMCGFIGFGKTTTARKIAAQHSAVLLTHDDFMVRLYGREKVPEKIFRDRWHKTDDLLWDIAEKIVCAGGSVVLDYGFWSKGSRKAAVERAKRFCDSVTFHQVECDMAVARKRLIERSKTDPSSLDISAETFDDLADRYEPISPDEGFDVIYYRNI